MTTPISDRPHPLHEENIMSIHHPIGSHSGKGNVTIGTREDGQHHVTVRMIASNTTATVAMLREAIEYIDPPADYADGGVTCAAIEQEAEKPVPLPEAVMRRLTRERDDARTMAALWKETARRAIQNPVTLARWEKDLLIEDFKSNGPVYTTGERGRHRAQIERAESALADVHERDETVARLEVQLGKAEVITDEAIGRFRTHMWEAHDVDLDPADAVDAITAALTPEPQRPEGAEDIERLIRHAEGGGWLDDPKLLADYIASSGVRVTGAES